MGQLDIEVVRHVRNALYIASLQFASEAARRAFEDGIGSALVSPFRERAAP